MSMNNTPMANRLAISIFGKRNAGKSSLINALTGQSFAIISPVAGTTTDPVYKTMELLPIGPVVITDTAGLDDVGELGALRIEKTYEVLRKTHLAIVVVSAEEGITDFERDFLADLKKRQTPTVVVFNKTDLAPMAEDPFKEQKKALALPAVRVSAATGEGIGALKELIIENARFDEEELGLVGDLVRPGEVAVLVTPIDKAAPKGRLILPQQQVIRDLLEIDAIAMITKEHELKQTLESLKQKPAIVITDSQAFMKVSADTPTDIPMTSFSILFARQKGDLAPMVEGLRRIEQLTPQDKVLIVEGCTHHRQTDDIGTVKIPRWIRQIVGGDVQFEWVSGVQYPKNIGDYAVIVHCGGCMLNRKEMQYRIALAREHGVAITNYGMLIAYTMGILPRALKPFPAAMLALEEA
ncbi:MAG: [FeFe] hydrogenase H-cluster maturation GTPase HydF [Eubacteriales bacterium]|nr:[FeFe] hydrogenase H-cluster maturation GTPase HydF [Eubacteriales bacterium]